MTYSIGAVSETDSCALSILNILLIGDTSWITPSNLARTGHLYSYDAQGNATFPADVKVRGRLDGEATDSGKLGGKAPEYYIQPRNLLDNSDFSKPVNQRGVTSMTASSASYTIDRWRLDGGKTITVGSDGITIDGGWLTQFIEAVRIDTSKVYTAALCLSDGTIICETGVFAKKTRGTYWGFDVSAAGVPYVEMKTGVTAKWVALYEGEYTAATLPPYTPKGYAAELAECQRYYHAYATEAARPASGMDCAPPMRLEKPTQGQFDLGGVTYYYNDANL